MSALAVAQKLTSIPSRAAGRAASVTAINVIVTTTTTRISATAAMDAPAGCGHNISASVTPVNAMAPNTMRCMVLIGWRALTRTSSLAVALRVNRNDASRNASNSAMAAGLGSTATPSASMLRPIRLEGSERRSRSSIAITASRSTS